MQWIALQTQPLAEAQAADPQALAWLALQFSPHVVLLDEAVLLEVSASLRLFGGLAALLRRLQTLLAQCLPTQVLLPPATGASAELTLGRLRAARTDPQGLRTEPAQLPLHTLSAARPHAKVLARMGCRTWGDLDALPRAGVARRFGPALLDALDAALGRQPRAWAWQRLPDGFDEHLELPAHALTSDALWPALDLLLARLHTWLRLRQCGVLALELIGLLDPRRDGPTQQQLCVRTARAAPGTAHVRILLAEHLALVRLAAPVYALRLRSLQTQALADAAAASGRLLLQDHPTGSDWLSLVERLSARLGAAQVCVWQARADHRPEHMQQAVPAHTQLGALATRHPRTPPQAQGLYPRWLLERPLRLLTRQHRPDYHGPLRLLAGPQRLETSGWAAGAAQPLAQEPVMRDYFIAHNPQAGLVWVYRQRTAQGVDWYLHGLFS